MPNPRTAGFRLDSISVGLGNTDFDLAASQPVSVIVDEVVLENVILKSSPLFDLERVEVLRGPQGTLFGRNTPAGIVKFDTVKPSQDFDADLALSYGELDSANVQGAIGGGLTDTVSARVSVLYQSRGDWIDNTAPPARAMRWAASTSSLGGGSFCSSRPSHSALLFNVHGRDNDGTCRRSSVPTCSARAATDSTRTTIATPSPTTDGKSATTRSPQKASAGRSGSITTSTATRR